MRSKLVLVMALVFGLLAAFLVYNYITGAKQAIQNQVFTQVVTATQDIPPNTTITDTMVAIKAFPTELRNGHEIVEIKDAVGKIAPNGFASGEVLLETRLVQPGEGVQKLSHKVPNGMRAITVPISEVTGVGNMLKVGDKVDLIGVVTNTQNPEPRSIVILQNIEILAMGSITTETATSSQAAVPATATLAMDPQSTLRLKMALDNASFTFTLRSPADKNFTSLTPVTLNEL